MPPEVERKFLIQAIDQRWTVLIQEGQETDGAFLGVAAGEGERPGVDELPAQRFVAALGRLDHLAVQRLEIALHPLQRRARRAFERWIECGHRRNQARHLGLDGLLGLGK